MLVIFSGVIAQGLAAGWAIGSLFGPDDEEDAWYTPVLAIFYPLLAVILILAILTAVLKWATPNFWLRLVRLIKPKGGVRL